jgi:murein DD-endopeptidase MepM/ murein hydrolase activator NlpD
MRVLPPAALRFALLAALLPPLERSPGLTSGFGEYRDGRFHAGLDYSTESTTGKPVRAVEDGWVERVRASGVGYGNAVYLRLGDGRTAVYAHLERFAPRLDAWVAARQDSSGRYEQDLHPPAGALPFRRGEILAWSGESGAGPPHLHFELRRGDMNLHPLRQGIAVPDGVAPVIAAVTLTPAGPRARVDGNLDSWRAGFGRAGELRAPPVEGSFRIALDTWDRVSGKPNRVATYRLSASLDGRPAFEAVLDSVSWDDMAIADRVYDLGATLAGVTGRRRLETTPRDRTGIVRRGVPLWSLEPGVHRIEFAAEDEAGNRTVRALRVTVLRPAAGPTADSVATAAAAPPARPRSRLLAAAGLGRPAVVARDLLVHVAARTADPRPPLAQYEGLELVDSLAVAGGTVWSLAPVGAGGEAPPGLPRVLRAGGGPGRAVLEGRPGAAREVSLTWDSLAFHEPAALVVRAEPLAPPGDGLVPVSAVAVEIGPGDLALAGPVRLAWSEASPPAAGRGVGLFRRGGRGWSLVATPDSAGGSPPPPGGTLAPVADATAPAVVVRGSTRRLGTFALLADTTAPVIVPPRRYVLRAGALTPAFSVRLRDEGSGLAAAEQRVLLDGRPVPAAYDAEAGRLTWRPRAPLAPGAHVLDVEAVDALGNRSSVRVPVEVR